MIRIHIKHSPTRGKHTMHTKSTQKLILCSNTLFRAQVKHSDASWTPICCESKISLFKHSKRDNCTFLTNHSNYDTRTIFGRHIPRWPLWAILKWYILAADMQKRWWFVCFQHVKCAFNVINTIQISASFHYGRQVTKISAVGYQVMLFCRLFFLPSTAILNKI